MTRGDQLPLLRTAIPGPRSSALARELHQFESRNITHVTPRWPVFWQRAAGANVWDVDGNRYIDLTGAFGVANAGHANPRIVAAIKKQAGNLMHAMGDVHPTELKLRLAWELVALTFGRWFGKGKATARLTAPREGDSPARVIFANSGAEAVEAALKTAVMRTGRPGVIAFKGGYHGLTYGALDVTARAEFREPFADQLGGFTVHVPYGVCPKTAALPGAVNRYGAVIVEPIQGRGGIRVPPDRFLRDLRAFCDRHGMVLVFDEVYTGFCRTGKWFACEHWGVVPDVVCVGKALTGGFPMSACIGRAGVMDAWPSSRGEAIHTSTFLGNPMGCAAALASIAELKRLKLDRRAAEMGRYARQRFEKIGRVRGMGLMLGLETDDAPRLCRQLLARGILALPEGDHGEVLGIIPPLVIARKQLDYVAAVLRELVGD
jgi:4-aminobutyrate aminotransferase-like enzyme